MPRRTTTVALAAAMSACGAEPVALRVLTYNVAGLPEGISGSHPERNTRLISPKLEPYDLVLVQEDFTYHSDLVSQVTHPYRSIPKEPAGGKLASDGLNVLARHAFEPLARTPWSVCHGGLDAGSDCLAEKGFAVTRLTLSDDLAVDLYDLHLDAGGGDEDLAAREAQVEQLLAAVRDRSADRALIIAGDTNLRRTRPRDSAGLDRLIASGLTDSCAATGCPEEDHIDRVFFRSGGGVRVSAERWVVDAAMVDDQGQDLSDHPAIAVDLRVEAE